MVQIASSVKARALSIEKDERAFWSWSRTWECELGSKDEGLEKSMAIKVGNGQCTWNLEALKSYPELSL